MLAYFVSHLMNLEGKSLKRNITASELLAPLRHEENKKQRSEDEAYLKKTFGLEE